jgi:hypothetical protein
VPQPVKPVPSLGEQCPEIRHSPFTCIFSSVPDGKDDRHEWLEYQPKIHGPVNAAHEVLKKSRHYFIHGCVLSLLTVFSHAGSAGFSRSLPLLMAHTSAAKFDPIAARTTTSAASEAPARGSCRNQSFS